jgi:phosphatidylserine/phosphatidylglycerophosphate/cardiolipin synthase-like enzyme
VLPYLLFKYDLPARENFSLRVLLFFWRDNMRFYKIRKTAMSLALSAVIGAGGTYSVMSHVQKTATAAATQVVSAARSFSATKVTSDSIPVNSLTCYFPREGQAPAPALINVIKSAKKSLDMAIYSFTDTSIADAVIADKKRGVTVRVVTDKTEAQNSYQKAVLNSLKKAGIPVKLNTHQGLMHLKVTVVDGSICTTGSFNYTAAAENQNDEVFIVVNNAATAAKFEAEFERMWNDAKNYTNY